MERLTMRAMVSSAMALATCPPTLKAFISFAASLLTTGLETVLAMNFMVIRRWLIC